MKKSAFKKTVILCGVVSLLFACSVADDFNLDLAKEQDTSETVDGETVVTLEKAAELADLFIGELTGSNVSTRSAQSGVASVEQLKEDGRVEFFTEWQPYGNGNFVPGWYSANFPGVEGGITYLYFHMKWGWQNGSNDGWFAFNNVYSGNGNYRHSRQDFYITKP